MLFGGRVALPYSVFALLAYMVVGKEFVMKSLIIFLLIHTKQNQSTYIHKPNYPKEKIDLGIITVNPPEVWPVFMLPTCG